MNKTMTLALLSTCLSFSAYADYFGCDLKVGHDPKVTLEAEYRGREVTVSHKGWTCHSVIASDGTVTVQLQSPQLNAASTGTGFTSARTGFSIQDPTDEEGEFISGSCYCSLR